jgi:aspartate kinase
MIVMKFGGTSVENARALETVITLTRREQHRVPVVVLSAVAGATNTLLQSAQLAVEGNLEGAVLSLNALLERHVSIAENLIGDRPTVQQLIFSFKRRFEEIKNLCHGIAILGELTSRSLDAIASTGEFLSTQIASEAMRLAGLPVSPVDARTFMLTDDRFTAATPLFAQVEERLRSTVLPLLEKRQIVVTQGFIGATLKGITSTLGRGGSDYSASLIGAALDAEEIQIWTDVDGILTADPRIAPLARKLKILSFREASELAYFGARVLHPSTILPAIAKKIPVVVLNSRRPEAHGTRIVADPPRTGVPVKSIASKAGITVLNIQSSRMLMAYGFLESIFSVFSRHQTPVDLVSTSEVAVSLTIDNTGSLDRIVEELGRFAEVTTLSRQAILCVVGDQMHSTAGVADRIFRSLGDVDAVMVSQGASENNMSIVIDETRVTEAVQRLHREFFEGLPNTDLFEPLGGV